METIKLLFMEKIGISWRKALTALIGLIFATACIGYLITHNFEELPMTYNSIIGGVFLFYFTKGFYENKKIQVVDKV
jgi:uncharacterized membrane protein